METTRRICCKGCGATGEARWGAAWHRDIQPTIAPAEVSPGFRLHGVQIVCNRCQQVFTPR